MIKLKKLIFSAVLAAAMIFAMSAPVFADGGAGSGGAKIVINIPSPLVSYAITNAPGNVYSAYKIFDLTTSGSGDTTNYAYTPAAAFADYPYPAEYGSLYDYISSFAEYSDDLNAEAKALWDYIVQNNIQPSGTTQGSISLIGDNTQHKVTISNLDYGYYLVYGKGTAIREVNITKRK
ncbi:MAG: hypothetical protein FWD71_21640 [Oscillospiraceae bacterium]|nr:hypothetical protein [Oscillospiraceae bacterium]